MKTPRDFFQGPSLSQLAVALLMALSLIGCGGSDNGASAESASTENPSSNSGQESHSQNHGLKDALAGMHLIDARVHAPAPGQPMSAGYFTLMNHGREAVTLVGINSDAVTVQMHTTSVENNGTTMRPLDAITIAPDDQIIFQPGGNHLMIRDLPADLKSLPLTMQFSNGASLETMFNVLPMDQWMNQDVDHSNH